MIRNAFWFIAGGLTFLVIAILDAVMPVRLRRKRKPAPEPYMDVVQNP